MLLRTLFANMYFFFLLFRQRRDLCDSWEFIRLYWKLFVRTRDSRALIRCASVESNGRSNRFRKWCWTYFESMAIASHVLHNNVFLWVRMKGNAVLHGFLWFFILITHFLFKSMQKTFRFRAIWCKKMRLFVIGWPNRNEFRTCAYYSLIRSLRRAQSILHSTKKKKKKTISCTNENNSKGRMEAKLRAKWVRLIPFEARCRWINWTLSKLHEKMAQMKRNKAHQMAWMKMCFDTIQSRSYGSRENSFRSTISSLF